MLVPILISFSQIIFSGGSENIIIGEMLLTPANEMFINVVEPLDQKMLITNNKTVIYYPNEKRAFNLEYPKNDLVQQNIPKIEPLDLDYYDQLGFKKLKEIVAGDTTTIQYISVINKKKPSLITIKTLNGNISQIIIASNMGFANYSKLDFLEYALFDNKEYIKNYTVSLYTNNELNERTTYNISDIKKAEKKDIERIKFVIPPEINIELRSFN